jgi:hypothetical protein
MTHPQIGQMRPVECAPGSGVARAILAQQRSIAILDFDGAVLRKKLLHPAVERDFRRGERARRVA